MFGFRTHPYVNTLEMGNAFSCVRPNDSDDEPSTAPSVKQRPPQRPPGNRSVQQTPAQRSLGKSSSLQVQQTLSYPPRNLSLETKPSVERTQNYPRLHTYLEVEPSEQQLRKFPRQLSFWESQFGGLFGSLPHEWSISEVDGLPDISQVSI